MLLLFQILRLAVLRGKLECLRPSLTADKSDCISDKREQKLLLPLQKIEIIYLHLSHILFLYEGKKPWL